MEDYTKIFIRSILAGICIAFGGAIFIKLGGIIGAVMFAFGLLTVVYFALPLYTGTAGFIDLKDYKQWFAMFIILFGNIVGCAICPELQIAGLQETATTIIQSRIDAGYYNCLMRAIGCGIIMTLIVNAGRNKNWLLILFGIPLFILLGFYHSIADAAYAAFNHNGVLNVTYLPYYGMIVLGNFIGCNVPRCLIYQK